MTLTMFREWSSSRIWGTKSGEESRLTKKGRGFIIGDERSETLLKMQSAIRNLVCLANFVQTLGDLGKIFSFEVLYKRFALDLAPKT
jgi:hypothetical protein